MYKYTVILRNSSLQALETGIYSQELLLKRITLIFWNMWGRHFSAFKNSAWAGCKIIGNISPPELLWGCNASVMPPSEFHSSGQFKASTFVRKEHYMSFGVPHGFHKSHCLQILGKTQELQDCPARNFMLRSFKRNEAAAEPERVNLGKHGFVCVRTALLLVCLVVTSATLNAMERGLAWKKPNKAPAHPVCTELNKGWQGWGFPVLQLALIVGMEGSMSFLNATFLPQHLCAHLLLVKHPSDSVLSTPKFFPCQRLHCYLWLWIA